VQPESALQRSETLHYQNAGQNGVGSVAHRGDAIAFAVKHCCILLRAFGQAMEMMNIVRGAAESRLAFRVLYPFEALFILADRDGQANFRPTSSFMFL
jgi:hypothetical protein